jgi:hypothetical protein
MLGFALLLSETVWATDADYQTSVRPLLQKYCFDCHQGDDAEAEVDLADFESLNQIRAKIKLWQRVDAMLSTGQMPPPESDQPSAAELTLLADWVRDLLRREAAAQAGDPGPVTLRRLNNDEYTYTIRDLTQVESLDPAREFPVDGAAGEGFTNTGDALGMSPALITKYLDAAKQIAEHAVLMPDGIRFSPHTSRRDWTNEALDRIRDFYQQFVDGDGSYLDWEGKHADTPRLGRLPLEPYLNATIINRQALRDGIITIADLAQQGDLNPLYLQRLWDVLNSETDHGFVLNDIRNRWRSGLETIGLQTQIERWQQLLWQFHPIGHLGRKGAPDRWMTPRNPLTDLRQLTAQRLPDSNTVQLTLSAGVVSDAVFSVDIECDSSDVAAQVLAILNAPAASAGSAEQVAAANAEPEAPVALETSLQNFRELFPAALCYSKIVPVDETVTLQLYYREDDHLKRLMCDELQAAELDRLWDELLFVAEEPLAAEVSLEQIHQFATQDRPDLVGEFEELRSLYRQRAADFHTRLIELEPRHVDALIRFAGQAWRRPLTATETDRLRAGYRALRDQELSHEQAIRLSIARVLIAPAFLYRAEQPGPGTAATPVSPYELATRLSYFLWSTMPDAHLIEVAESAALNDDATVIQQARRMLTDPRIRRLAIHFACQWLHIRNFDQTIEKNERLYPEFAQLRGDVYEESILFFTDMFQNDGSILDLIAAQHTFVNERLAELYGIEGVTGQHWQRVDGIQQYGRGGVLGMATVLASQSGASRTSPILRGNWVYETLLGERLPRPPAGIPQLPDTVPAGKTARELIELHSGAPQCARCHVKIDPYGFALEQFDAIGRLRTAPTNTVTTLPDGQTIDGLNGLRDYLMQQRRDDVVRQFCKKLLGYALGREVQLSDESLLEHLQNQLAEHDCRFSTAIETIVISPQFRQIRGQLADRADEL